jgi:citrate lyase subunit beta/citryl-CoA lyase
LTRRRSLGLVILAARAHGIAAIDGVALDLEDDEAFRWACEQARNMGYDGKTLIHPKTIDVANEVCPAVVHACLRGELD